MGGAIGALIALIMIAIVIITLTCLILTMRGRTGSVERSKNIGNAQTFPNAMYTGCKQQTRDSQNNTFYHVTCLPLAVYSGGTGQMGITMDDDVRGDQDFMVRNAII